MKNAMSQTLGVIEKTERDLADDLQRQREAAKKFVPPWISRSIFTIVL